MSKQFKFYFLWLALICVIMFILQTYIPIFTDFFVLNAKALFGFQIWRFISAIFLHGSIIHLAYNMFALLFFGMLLEKLVGSKRFLIIFFASGILANIISVNFYPSSLGASGAIMGIIGAMAILKPMMMVWAFGLIMPMFIAAILWIIGDILGIFFPSGIGNIAHLSGLGVGVLIAIYYRFFVKKKKPSNKLVLPERYIQIWEDENMKR